MKKKYTSGYTLIEVMVVVVILGIVASIAAPSFSTFITNSRITTSTNNFISSIALARSEAVKRNNPVHVTATAPVVNNEWGGGWTIWENTNPVVTIRVVEATPGTVTLDEANGITELSFEPTGLLDDGGGTSVDICGDVSGEGGRQITISRVGRPNLNRDFICP